MVRVNQKIWLAKMFTVMLASLVLSMPEPVAVPGYKPIKHVLPALFKIYIIIRLCVEQISLVA